MRLMLSEAYSYAVSTHRSDNEEVTLEFKVHGRVCSDRNPEALVEVDITFFPYGLRNGDDCSFGTVIPRFAAYQRSLFGK